MAGISKAERDALAEVKNKFQSVELDAEQAATAEKLRAAFGKLAVELHKALPDGRNKSLAMTSLEDSGMRAIRSLSHDKGAPAQAEAPEPEPTPAPSSNGVAAVKKTAEAKAARPRSRRALEVVTA